MEHFIMELYQQPSLRWGCLLTAVHCPSLDSLVTFSAAWLFACEAALSVWAGWQSLVSVGGEPELPRHRAEAGQGQSLCVTLCHPLIRRFVSRYSNSYFMS